MDSLKCKYGDFSGLQVSEIKQKMRKQIFFLLVIVDPQTSHKYTNVDVNAALENVLQVYGSLNDLLGYPSEMVEVMVMLNAAHMEYQKGKESFDWHVYRKLILDAGSAVSKIKEV